MTAARATAAGVLLALALVACSSSDDGNDDEDAAPRSTTTTTATATTSPGQATSTSGQATSTTTAAPRPSAASPPKVGVDRVARLDQPLALVPHPRTGELYVAEKGGKVRRQSGNWSTILDISDGVSSGGERGLLGLAIHPNGGYLYVDYTDREGDSHVDEYALRDDGSLDAGSRREVLFQDQPYANHNGGHLVFGPDGLLYIGFGDGGSQGDPNGNGQRLDTLLAKILRIDPRPPASGDGSYAIPPGNPFAGRQGARGEIWAFGLRNPWRFSFDRATGELWIGDVGGSAREEVDRAPAGTGGQNYGWSLMEGTVRANGAPPAGHVAPVHEYATRTGGCAITGGNIYRGNAIAGLAGYYVFGDYCRGELLALRPEDPGRAVPLGVQVASLASFAEDGDGELYALSLQGDVVRLRAA